MDWILERGWHVHRVAGEVRRDTDRMDMVYHGTYASVFGGGKRGNVARCRVVYAQMEQEGVLLPVVQLNLTYKQPAGTIELLDVHTHTWRSPTSKMVFAVK